MFILAQACTRTWWFCGLTEGSMSKLLNRFIHLETWAKFYLKKNSTIVCLFR